MAVETLKTTLGLRSECSSALRRHWIVATVPVIVLVAVALVLGLERAPRYTATANLSVGRIYISNPAGVSGVLRSDAVARVRLQPCHPRDRGSAGDCT